MANARRRLAAARVESSELERDLRGPRSRSPTARRRASDLYRLRIARDMSSAASRGRAELRRAARSGGARMPRDPRAGAPRPEPPARTASNDRRSKRPVVTLTLEPLRTSACSGFSSRLGIAAAASWPGRREQLAHLIAEVVLVQHQASRRLAQPPADADLVDSLAQHAFHALQELLLLIVGLAASAWRHRASSAGSSVAATNVLA